MVRSPLDTPLWRFAYSFLPTLWKAVFRMKITGAEHIPLQGPVLLACNHRSNLDPFFLGVASPRQVHFMAKAELWKVQPLGRVIDAMGAFPVKRGGADRQAVRRALEMLDKGAVVGIFPEGHRQRDGGFGEVNPGVSLFALREGVVTIPVVMEGTDGVVRKGLLRSPRVRVTFGAPLQPPPKELARAERSEATGRALADAFRSLSRQSGCREVSS
ncbi:MAG: lysophospholipid acyltransferase family protein [Thermoleophilia bacterium]